jgi:hypothetical protein
LAKQFNYLLDNSLTLSYHSSEAEEKYVMEKKEKKK